MDDPTDQNFSSNGGFCPICSTLQQDLNDHMSIHSKEDILQSFSFKNLGLNASNNQASSNANVATPSSTYVQRQQSLPILNPQLFAPSYNNMTPIASNNIVTPNFIPLPTRNVFGASTSNAQFNNNSSVLISNSQFNMNTFKGTQPMLNSFPLTPFINQPMMVPSNQVCGLSSNLIDVPPPKVTLASVPSNNELSSDSRSSQNLTTVGTTTSTDTSAIASQVQTIGQQPQTMLCVMPYTQPVQAPAVNAPGTYILYGNNLIPSSSVLPDISPGGVNYMIPNNNTSTIGISPNQTLFSTNSFPNLDVKPDISSSFTNIPTPVDSLPLVTLNPNGNLSNQPITFVESVFKKDKVQSLVNDNEENNAVIEIGKNIKITLPKDVIGRKEKVKELINKELVRALLINEAEELADSSEEEVGIEEIKKTSNDFGVNSYTVCCTPSKSGMIEQNNIKINPSNSSASSYYTQLPTITQSNPSTGRDRTKLDELPISSSYLGTNFAIDLSTSNSLANKSTGSLSETKNLLKSDLKIEDSLLVSSLADLNFSFMSTDKNLSSIFGSNFTSSSYAEEQVLGAVEEVFANENETSPSKAGPSNISLENQLMQLFPPDETVAADEDLSTNSPFQNTLHSPSKLRTYFNPRKYSNSSKLKGNKQNCLQTFEIQNENPKDLLESSHSASLDPPFIRGTEDSNDSKEIQNSFFYKAHSIKPENGESNGTEEVMSLKASETLADSDSERATPNEEVELFFVGEAGPTHFSKDLSFSAHLENTDAYNNIEDIQVPMTLGNSIVCESNPETLNDSVDSGVLDQEDNETINMTIDSNCCILPDDALTFIQETEAAQSSTLESMWSKQAWIEDVKPLVASGILPSVISPPLASTSGLQTLRSPEQPEEEYDFDYESDCYGDSSDPEVPHRSHSENWCCLKCHKTFKSLKEKLLHSGHHECETKEEASVCKTEQMKSEVPEDSVDSKEAKCSECSRSFQTVDALFEHRVLALKSRLACPLCHTEFKKRLDRMRHLKTHPQKDLRCLICNRAFDGCHAWAQHQLQHLGFVAYECADCGFKCMRKGELAVHRRKHTGERPFSCKTCDRAFMTNHSLKRHLITHLKGQEAECDLCHRKYKNAVGLNKHKMQVHSKKRRFFKKRSDFMCAICDEVVSSEKKLKWHLETHERWPKKCPECGDCFIHTPNLTKHIRMKHNAAFVPEGNRDNEPCPVCSKVYKKSSMAMHMRTHTGDKPYICNVCNRRFSVKCNFISHRWVHMGVRDRPFKCKLCERSFHRKRFLESHVRSHKKIRPYTCNECGKAFIHKNNFRTHVKQHTEDKQHECEHCGKTFHRKYNLNNHVRIHTGETPYECNVCKKEFTQKSNYNVHMKAFHVERHAVHEEV